MPSTTKLVLHLSCPARKDNGHWFSHTSMRTELVNYQGSHLREPMQTNPLSVNVHLLRRMRQLRLAVLQGQKKGKCVFLTKTHTRSSPFFRCCLDINCDARKLYAQERDMAETDHWSNQSPCVQSHTHTRAQAHTPLCFPLMCCSNVNWGANWNGGISLQQWQRNKSFLWPLAHSGPRSFSLWWKSAVISL